MMAAGGTGYLNGHPIVDDVSVDLLHKTENGRDVGVDVRIKGVPNACVLIHRSCIMAATGTGRAVRHDVLFPDAQYPLYQWEPDGKRMRPAGMLLDCRNAAQAAADANAHYGRTRGLAISFSTLAKNNDVAATRMAARRNNTVTQAYLAGAEQGRQEDEDDFDL